MDELARCTSTWRPALAVAAAALALAGCGSSRSPLDAAVAAAKKTLALHGAAYDVSFSRPALFGPSVQVPGGKAGSDFAAGLGYERLTLTLAGGASRNVFLDYEPRDVLVLPYPAPERALPAGKDWISVELTGRETGAGAALATQLEGLGPELPLAEIAWGATSAANAGTRVVEHVPMAGYRVAIDLRKALAGARRAGKSGLAAAITGELAAAASGRTSVTIWVNGPGYASRLENAAPGGGMGTATFSFTSFASKLAGQRPETAQIVPLSGLQLRSRSLWSLLGST